MKKLKTGDSIPSFSLPDQNGEIFSVDSVLGRKNLVIFFYPKDESPGCTKEACAFRDHFEVFAKADAMVIGISSQSVESHKAFAQRHGLNFVLLSDSENTVKKAFGVPSSFFGLIPGRVTYVAGKDGKVIFTFNSQTRAAKHVQEALQILQSIK